jgi:hypothetical protein
MGEGGCLLVVTTTSVTIGGAAVTATTGVTIPAGTAPVFVPGARTRTSVIVPAGADDTCDLYAISTGASATVSWFAPQGG